jgi:hypothetical protein
VKTGVLAFEPVRVVGLHTSQEDRCRVVQRQDWRRHKVASEVAVVLAQDLLVVVRAPADAVLVPGVRGIDVDQRAVTLRVAPVGEPVLRMLRMARLGGLLDGLTLSRRWSEVGRRKARSRARAVQPPLQP